MGQCWYSEGKYLTKGSECRARLGGDEDSVWLSVGVEEGVGVLAVGDGVGWVATGVAGGFIEEWLLEILEAAGDEEGDGSLGVCGLDERRFGFADGALLVVFDAARPPLSDQALREGDLTYCGYEGDLKSAGESDLLEEEGRVIVSEEVMVDEEEGPGRAAGEGFMA